ncbi:MAG: hypothetical protein ABI972_24220 [Acidobacteriota bacterium]
MELVEEGQYFEAEIIDGVENAPDAESESSEIKPVVVDERAQSKDTRKK